MEMSDHVHDSASVEDIDVEIREHAHVEQSPEPALHSTDKGDGDSLDRLHQRLTEHVFSDDDDDE